VEVRKLVEDIGLLPPDALTIRGRRRVEKVMSDS
jgi:hypothetical protein